MKAIHSEEEKELWVNSGILNLVFKIILNNGNGDDMYNVIPIKIGKHLINDNINACKILGNNYLSIISGEFDWECLGIFQSLYVFVGIKPFRDVIDFLLPPYLISHPFIYLSFIHSVIRPTSWCNKITASVWKGISDIERNID